MDEDAPQKKADAGAPAWITTFADLAILLMCFFVLLLAFSEMDAQKYKQVAGSMKQAFGVQRDVKVKQPPKGVNVIAREFSPGKPEPTPLNEVRQKTTDDLRRHLKIPGVKTDKSQAKMGQLIKALKKQLKEAVTKVDADKTRQALKDEIDKGMIDVEAEDQKVIIRIREKGSFSSGSASLIKPFQPVLRKIGKILIGTEGRITVAGHTDSVPISNQRFRSNWELSTSRAVTVVHGLIETTGLPAERFHIEGYGETRPIANNDTSTNRAKNRRVEIAIVQGQDLERVMDDKPASDDGAPATEETSGVDTGATVAVQETSQ